MKHVFFIFLLVLSISSFGQQMPRRALKELINTQEPAWPMVEEWIVTAKNHVEVLPKSSPRADSALYEVQVTTRSPMGAVVYETGGILVDHGWIRILGSGCDRMDRSLMKWNQGKSFVEMGEPTSFLLVADDVLGGFFAINAGGIAAQNFGKIYYFAPDSREWEETGFGYTEFLNFCFTCDLELFYKGLRWENWEKDVAELNGNQGFSFYPFLGTEQAEDINTVSRAVVPMQELWSLYFGK